VLGVVGKGSPSSPGKNVAFFYIHCLTQVTEALSLYQTYSKLDDGLDKRFQSVEKVIKTVCPNNLSDELKVQLSDVTSQVKDLISNNNQLQKRSAQKVLCSSCAIKLPIPDYKIRQGAALYSPVNHLAQLSLEILCHLLLMKKKKSKNAD